MRNRDRKGTGLDVLATLVEAWEEKHFPIEVSQTPSEAIQHQMEALGMSRRTWSR